jgi:hypothetical protein
MRALRDATLGQAGAWTPVCVGVAITALFLCVGMELLREFVRLARADATLSLT